MDCFNYKRFILVCHPYPYVKKDCRKMCEFARKSVKFCEVALIHAKKPKIGSTVLF
jgi:hypothetical protein